tara:strand:+ start:2874 stop:3059 length:186 start_codon:yes stop_codon:yes gene_type:complete
MREHTPIEAQILEAVKAKLKRLEASTSKEFDMDKKAIMDLMSRIDSVESALDELKTRWEDR